MSNKKSETIVDTVGWVVSGDDDKYSVKFIDSLQDRHIVIKSTYPSNTANTVINLSKTISRSLYSDSSLIVVNFKYRNRGLSTNYSFIGIDVINEYNQISSKNIKKLNTRSKWITESISINNISESSALILTIGLFEAGVVEFSELELVIDNEFKIIFFEDETPTDMDSLRLYVHPQTGTNDFGNFKDFNLAIANSKLIALGECTHGSLEISKDRIEMFKYLVNKHDYSVLCMELDMSTSNFINSFLLKKDRTINEIVNTLPLIMQTQEIVDLFTWIQNYNEDHAEKILIYGYDIKSSNVAFLNLKRFASSIGEEDLMNEIIKVEKTNEIIFEEYKTNGSDLKSIDVQLFQKLDSSISDLLIYFKNKRTKFAKQLESEDYNWALQNINLISQFGKSFYDYNLGHDYVFNFKRDSSMFTNIEWILKRYPKSKIAIWGHNNHIKKSKPYLGSYLNEKYKRKYLSIGYATYSGDYSAEEGTTLKSGYKLTPAPKGSYEYSFNQINDQSFIVDLTKKPHGGFNYFSKIKLFRSVGAYPTDYQFYYYSNLTEDYDFLKFFNKTTSSKPLHE